MSGNLFANVSVRGVRLLGMAVFVSVAFMLGWLAAPSTASACGCFVPPDPVTPVVQAGERIVFALDGDDVVAHIQIQYQGAAKDFGWLLPLPSYPQLELSTEELFLRLDENTAPDFVTLPREGSNQVIIMWPAGQAQPTLARDGWILDAPYNAIDPTGTEPQRGNWYQVVGRGKPRLTSGWVRQLLTLDRQIGNSDVTLGVTYLVSSLDPAFDPLDALPPDPLTNLSGVNVAVLFSGLINVFEGVVTVGP